MITNYVRLKSDVTIAMRIYVEMGYTVYRVRTECGCPVQNNRRNGIIVVNGNVIEHKVLRCKGCAPAPAGKEAV